MNDKMRFPVREMDQSVPRLCMILWGPSGAGKTTWAATAPGKKVWITLGDNEHASLLGRKDVKIMSLFNERTDDIFMHGASAFGLDRYLYENRDVKTIVLDSLTALQQRALEKSVNDGMGRSVSFTPTIVVPGRAAYGGRLQYVLMIMDKLMEVTAKHNVHMIFTAHEQDARTKSDGRGGEIVDEIPISLGGQLINLTTSRISEMWHIREEPTRLRRRIITIRPSGGRRPMKSRMFWHRDEASFVLEYDPEKPDNGQMTIASFYEQWKKAGGKISIPNNRRGGDKEDNADRPRKTTV